MTRTPYHQLLSYIELHEQARLCRQVEAGQKGAFVARQWLAVTKRRMAYQRRLARLDNEPESAMMADALRDRIAVCQELLAEARARHPDEMLAASKAATALRLVT